MSLGDVTQLFYQGKWNCFATFEYSSQQRGKEFHSFGMAGIRLAIQMPLLMGWVLNLISSDQSQRLRRPQPLQRLIGFATGGIIRSKKLFELSEKCPADIAQRLDILVRPACYWHSQYAIVAHPFTSVALPGGDRSNDTTLHQASANGRRFAHDQRIQRISIARQRLWDETEVDRKGEPLGQFVTNHHEVNLFIVSILKTTTHRGFDHHMNMLIDKRGNAEYFHRRCEVNRGWPLIGTGLAPPRSE